MNKKYVNRLDTSFNEIKYIKENTPIDELIGRTVQLKRSGSILKGLCPFHSESTPSFTVFEKTQTYHCFGCNEGGDIFTFLGKTTNLSFKHIKDYLMNRFVKPTTMLNNRVIPREEMKEHKKARVLPSGQEIPVFSMGYIWSHNRNMFMSVQTEEVYEYVYEDGTIAGYILFHIGKNGKKTPLPVSLTEKLTEDEKDTEIVWGFGALPSPKPMFNLLEVKENERAEYKKPILVVEGERCASKAKAIMSGFVVTTWSGGASVPHQTDWSPIEKQEVFLWPDNELAGKAAMEKIAMQLPDVEILKIPEDRPVGWDIADAIKEGQTEEQLSDFILSFRRPKEEPLPSKFEFDMPPGLLGELTDYILAASPIPHPLLATGAALSILSILSAQKIVTEDGVHPNLYIVTLAESGVGKNASLVQIKEIMGQIGCKKLLTGSPASGAGLISALNKRKGRVLMPADEFGHIIGGILGASGDNCKKNLLEYFLNLFTASGSDFYDVEYSDRDKDKPQRIISKPNLVIYGTSTPESFYEPITKDSSLDGFLARLLVLEGVDRSVKNNDSHCLLKSLPGPLKERLMQWGGDPVNIMRSLEANYDSIEEVESAEYDFAPHVIHYELEARRFMRRYGEECRNRSYLASKSGEGFRSSVFNRSWELASKVALLARTHGGYVDLKAVEWATKFVDLAVERFTKRAKEYIHSSDFDKLTRDLQRYLKGQCSWTDKRNILNRFRIKSSQLKEVLDYLMDADIIEHRILTSKKEGSTPVPQWRIKS